MADESSSEGLFHSLDPDRQEEFLRYHASHQVRLIFHAGQMLENSGLFLKWECQEVACNCVQEAFDRLLNAMDQRSKPFSAGRGNPDHVRNWLYMVTKRLVIAHLRKMKDHTPANLQTELQAAQRIDSGSADSLVDKAHIDDLLARLDSQDQAIVGNYAEGIRAQRLAQCCK